MNQLKRFQRNAGTGMVAGVIIGVVVALIVSVTMGDDAVWSWAIPVGVAVGLAVGAKKESSDG